MNSHFSSLQEVRQILKTFVAQTNEKAIIGKHQLKYLLDLTDELDEELEEKEKIIQNLRKKMDTIAPSSSASQCEIQDLKKKLESIQKEKDSLEKKAKQNDEALQLVREIVSAKYANNSSTQMRDLYDAVNLLANYIQEELLGSRDVEFPNTTMKTSLTKELEKWTARAKKSWQYNKIVVAFIGGYNAGKTSIVNRILSQDRPNALRLPTDVQPTTAYPTYICRGLSTRYDFLTPDNKQKILSEATFKRMKKKVLDLVGCISPLIQYLIITFPNECLENLSILDTPGIDSGDPEDKKRTKEVINESDALFWVTDGQQGCAFDDKLKFIEEYVEKPIYVIINRTENMAPKLIGDVERHIRSTFKEKGINVQGCISFSKKAPLEPLMTLIRGVKKTNKEDLYLDTIQSVMAEIVQSCRQNLQDANMRRSELEKKIGDIDQQYKSIKACCDAISEIPRTIESFWSLPHWEMNVAEHSDFQLGVSIIKDEIDEIKKKQETYNTLVEQWRDAYDAYKDCRTRLGVLCRKQELLNRYIKQYNKKKKL